MIKTKLLTGTKGEARSRLKERFVHNRDILERIKGVLLQDRDSSFRRMMGEDKYSLPNWAMYQSDQMGYQRALTEVIELLTVGENDD